jgi:transketolase
MSVLFFGEMRRNVNDPHDPDADEFVLSKGHGAPILYAALRRSGCVDEDILTLRQHGSPYEGHPMPRSLPWVKVATGSLGQGLSVGVGMALAARKSHRKSRVYVLLGDSELAEGSVFEALQLAAFYGLSNLCAVADVNRLGQSGPTMLGHDMRAYRRRYEALGSQALPVDGHNVDLMRIAFDRARMEKKRPSIILAKTTKGKGVSFLEDREDYHGKPVSPEDLEKALAEIPEPKMPKVSVKSPRGAKPRRRVVEQPEAFRYEKGKEKATRAAYGSAVARLAKADPRIIALDGEVSNSTKSELVREQTPDQYIEGFIAEENLVGMALGMSVRGLKPFVSSFAAFLTRAHDQIRMAGYSSANVTFAGSHAGVSIGEDGPSQMGLEDLAMFRAVYGSTILYPCDAVSTERLVEAALKAGGIKYIRTTRPKTPVIYDNREEFPLGDFKVLRRSDGDQAVVVGAGVTLHEALEAHDRLGEIGIPVAVVDCYSVKPFKAEKLARLAERSGQRVIVAEDHAPEGGMGEMISRALNGNGGNGFSITCLAVSKMPRSGKPEELLAEQGIDAKAIVDTVEALIHLEKGA